MTSTNFNESNFDFSGEQSLVNNLLDPDNIAGNLSSLLTSEIIFVDETVEDYQQLVAEIDADVYRLDSNLDGIEQITEVLSQYEDISGIHLISHGNEGSLKLGATELNQENLEEYGDRLKLWNDSLLDDADFLIYGCDVAEGDTGKEFVSNLSNLIGADVAASDDLTGNQDLGGDWDLEYATGEIEAVSISSSEYQDVLATASLTDGTFAYESTSDDANDLTISIEDSNLIIEDTAETPTVSGNVSLDGDRVVVPLEDITSAITINTGDGDDSISLAGLDFSQAVSFSINGQGGNDTVTFNGDFDSYGGALTVNSETIIASGVVISTRQVS